VPLDFHRNGGPVDEMELSALAKAFLQPNPQIVTGSHKVEGTCLFEDILVERSIIKAAHAVSDIGKVIVPHVYVRFSYTKCVFEFVRGTLVDALYQNEDVGACNK